LLGNDLTFPQDGGLAGCLGLVGGEHQFGPLVLERVVSALEDERPVRCCGELVLRPAFRRDVSEGGVVFEVGDPSVLVVVVDQPTTSLSEVMFERIVERQHRISADDQAISAVGTILLDRPIPPSGFEFHFGLTILSEQ
jgi:hypothetical protein